MDPTTGAWGWALMVAASLVGSLNLGVAFMGIADQAAPSDAPRQSTVAPSRAVSTYVRISMASTGSVWQGDGATVADGPCSARAPIASWQHLHGPSTRPQP